jgi:hypothetical protein
MRLLRRMLSAGVAALVMPVAACAVPGGSAGSNVGDAQPSSTAPGNGSTQVAASNRSSGTNLSHPVATSSGEIRTTSASHDYLFADGGSGAIKREKDLPVYYRKITDQERDNVVHVCDDFARVAIVKAAGFNVGLGIGTLFQRGIGGGPGPVPVNTDLDSVRTGCVKKHAPFLA